MIEILEQLQNTKTQDFDIYIYIYTDLFIEFYQNLKFF